MQKIETHKVMRLGKTPVTVFCEVGPEADETHRSFLYAKDYPAGTIVEITLPKQEDKIILPDGMWWDERNYLWFNGLVVARAKETRGWYHPPFTLATKEAGNCENADQVKRLIELALAYWGHYGVRKECVGEKKTTYSVLPLYLARQYKRDDTISLFKYFMSGRTIIDVFLKSIYYEEGTTVKITYPETKPEVVYPGGAYWNDDGCLINKTGQMIGHASPDGGTAMYTDSSGCLYTRTASAGFENQDEAKGWVVNQLAKHRHYGFRFRDK